MNEPAWELPFKNDVMSNEIALTKDDKEADAALSTLLRKLGSAQGTTTANNEEAGSGDDRGNSNLVWAEPNLEEAAAAMKRIADTIEATLGEASQASANVLRNYGSSTFHSRLKSVLQK